MVIGFRRKLGEKCGSQEEDQVLPFENFLEAQELLTEHQIPFESHALNGLGHGIDHHGIRIGKEFLRKLSTEI